MRCRFSNSQPVLPVLALTCAALFAQDGVQQSVTVNAPRIIAAMNEADLVTLAGNTHPLALQKFDAGAVPDTLYLDHMSLQLRRSVEQEQALERLIDDAQDPSSAGYHVWLTAERLRRNFGPAESDITAVTTWLASHGLKVNAVHVAGMAVDFSGTAGQVRDTFHTEIHTYNIRGNQHIANSTDPKIPAALAPVVMGVAALHDFKPKSQLLKRAPAFSFSFDNLEQYDVAPADFATIYNVTPLYKAGPPITGKGQIVVVLEDTDINPADFTTFRTAFGLSSYSGTLSQVHPGCTDPGTGPAEGEAALDAEWAGAIAPDADVELASCPETATAFGPLTAAQNLLDSSNPPPVMSLSYTNCEAGQGPAYNAYMKSLWQQAAIEGTSVYVSAGDGGTAGCDNFDLDSWAIAGTAVNGLASTPYNVATGGTDFLDTFEGTNSTYWGTSNITNGKSVRSYVPEMTWNDSCASGILSRYYGTTDVVAFCNTTTGSNFLDIIAGSGGASFVYSAPSWQSGVLGIPSNGKRNLPDVSLFASNGFWSHAILYCMSDANQGGTPCDYSNPMDAFYNSGGGTSFTAPQFASIQALINQKAGGRQGNPNPMFYKLAAAEFGTSADPNSSGLDECSANKGNEIGSSCIFHDVVWGNNDVPCYGTNNCYSTSPSQYGVLSKSSEMLESVYPAHKGWDFATGLGSVNVTRLVNNWK